MTKTGTPPAEDVGRFYDEMAGYSTAELGDALNLHFGYWDTPDDDRSFEQACQRLTEVTTEQLRIGVGSRALDVGCGVGAPALQVGRDTGASVVGVTVSNEQVRRANGQATAVGLADRLSFRYADASALPFEDGSFDAAWALESLIHMDRPVVLREIARVLKPGGRLGLTDFFERGPLDGERRRVVDKFYRTHVTTDAGLIDTYPTLLREAGLRLVELVDISEQTVRRSLLKAAEMIGDDPDNYAGAFSSETISRADALALADTWQLGYLLVVAERPGETP
ncbi:hypothetical protein CC117_24050 [Parafrankia colletiae]|uniref:Polyketide synthase-like methyltransferase domain-containing protein n=1 Tax=Parafrankia colletiae TaxID=573497 RepID=A0A1S1QII4_9ACTN|nr:methyltransferase domain-containing protein [Parafrankia colletiae]MCK9901918.1 methyltransferase domain-containing protein [Frankia sp. Cpl3]OHV32872.1 hypothetical protein CC117_24050 [Parafrankia colletiae]